MTQKLLGIQKLWCFRRKNVEYAFFIIVRFIAVMMDVIFVASF